MLVCRVSSFIHRDEGSELGKFFFKSVGFFYELNLQSDYLIGKAFFVGCLFGFSYWEELTKMRKALINKFNIIIHFDYLQK